MTSNQIAETISVELFNRMVNGIESRITSTGFKGELTDHSDEINKSLSEDYKQITSVLQSVVDSFYMSKYEVNSFQAFSLKDFDFCLRHNLELIQNCKKLIKFAS